MRCCAVIHCGNVKAKADVNVSPQPASGDKRKATISKITSSKKRRTDQGTEEESPLPYGLGTHYPYAYAYPGAPPPPPVATFQPSSPNPTTEMSFNEFQWRLLNLCGEFYEAATELIVCRLFIAWMISVI